MQLLNKTRDKIIERVWKQFFSKSTLASVIIVVVIVLVFINLHPFNEDLASKIATALITVDGLILGFIIVGVTVVAERGFSKPRMTAIFEKHFKEFLNELRVMETSGTEKMAEKLTSTAESAIVDIISVPSVLFVTMFFLLTSLLSALMLFGVSDTMVSNPVYVSAFRSVMWVSVFFLVIGFHLTIRVLQDLTIKTDPEELLKSFEEALNRIKQDLKQTTDTKKE